MTPERLAELAAEVDDLRTSFERLDEILIELTFSLASGGIGAELIGPVLLAQKRALARN